MEINSIFLKLYLAAAAWIDLEIVTLSKSEKDRYQDMPYIQKISHQIITLSEVSQTEKDRSHDMPYI